MEPEVVALLESGCATFVGTVDAGGNPAAAHAMGARVLADGAQLRVVLNAEEHVVLDNLRTNRVVALGATEVPTLRSVQVKGRALTVEPVTAEDRIRTGAYLAEYFEEIHRTDGTEVERLRRLVPRDFVVMVMTVDELFDQTPGPQAGTRLGRP
jgi:predicted pyridoxine 5'-phosphate oxidase superfamily flavin-nucleotide-binding protein